MGSWFRLFSRDERGTSLEGVALSVSVIAVAFVASADMLDYITRPQGNPNGVTAFKRSPTIPSTPAVPAATASADLDETPTATVPRLVSRSILDPCTGAIK